MSRSLTPSASRSAATLFSTKALRARGRERVDGGDAPVEERDHTREKPKRRCPLRCATCRAVITGADERRVIHGAHAHRRVNPEGHDFHLGCFAEADGARAEGRGPVYWTWFPGYAWRIAHCAECDTHLGWEFNGAGDRFFGLILERLVEGGEPP